MARRAGPKAGTPPRPRATRRGRATTRLRRRITSTLVLVLLLVAGAVVLERAAVLPEPVAVVVRHLEAWLAPVLRDLGLDLPPSRPEGAPPSSGTPGGQADDQAAVAQALALLDRLVVAPERRRGYDREDWPHWVDADGDCVDARHEVLAAESLEPVRWSVDGCDVASGLWRDVYTGRTTRNPSDLDVDHFVPLAEAHRSGGHAWSAERRAAFANDLGDGRSLIAVSASANRSKSDQGPEEWLPPEETYRCRYVANWVTVKVRWSLAMDERERVTVGNLLRGCVRT